VWGWPKFVSRKRKSKDDAAVGARVKSGIQGGANKNKNLKFGKIRGRCLSRVKKNGG
jgi:hypothetical protein